MFQGFVRDGRGQNLALTALCVPCSLKKRRSGEDDEADFASVEEEAFTLVSPRNFCTFLDLYREVSPLLPHPCLHETTDRSVLTVSDRGDQLERLQGFLVKARIWP